MILVIDKIVRPYAPIGIKWVDANLVEIQVVFVVLVIAAAEVE